MFKNHYPVAYFLRVLVVACLLPGVLGFTVSVFIEYREERERVLRENKQRAHAVGQAIDNQLLRAQGMLRSFANADEIVAGDLQTFSKRAARAIADAELAGTVVLHRIDDDKVLRYSPGKDAFGVDEADTTAPRTVLEQGIGAVSNVVTDPASHQTSVRVHVPVIVGGKVIYAVGIALPTAQFTAMLLDQGLPSGWLASLVDRKGVIAGRSRNAEKFVGQFASATLRDAISASDTGALETITRDGIANLTVYARSARNGYTTVIGVPQDELIGPFKRKIVRLIGAFVLVLGLGLLLARYMSQLIANSVHALIRPASALGQGKHLAVARVHLSEAKEVALAITQAAKLLANRDAALSAQKDELQRFFFISEKASEMLLLHDEQGRFRYANEMASRSLGYSHAALLEMTVFEIEQDATPASLEALFAQCRSTEVAPFERRYLCKDGSIHMVEITATVLQHQGEWLMHVAARDISERLQAERAVRWAASHDLLTGLANRALARQRLGQILAGEHGGQNSGTLLYLDLDRFKPVNDLYGHEIGDRVLQIVSKRIEAVMRQGDLLARLGGDEFLAVLPGQDGGSEEVLSRVEALIQAVSAPIEFGNIEVKLSVSIGISRFPEDGTTTDILVHAADLAMLSAKQEGRNRYRFYSADMDEKAQLVINVERRLQQALDKGQFTLHFQPIINLGSGAIDGVESLIRLDDDMQPALEPATFIPVAEMCGLIVPIGDWVALEACRQQKRWADSGVKLQVSVNVSALQFQRSDFLHRIGNLIASSGIDPRYLVVELTETAVMENKAEAAQVLDELKRLGIRIALDDFGTGYSSLSILSLLPIDKIKIDQSFVRRVETDPASCAVVDAVIALAKRMKLEVVAEGIENDAMLRYLRERGCEHGQGYHFSRPLTAPALLEWYQQQRANTAGSMRASHERS